MKTIISLFTVFSMMFSSMGTTLVHAEYETWYAGHPDMGVHAEPWSGSEIVATYNHADELKIIGCEGDYWQTWEPETDTYGWIWGPYMVDDPAKWSFGIYLGSMLATLYTPDPAENAGYTTDCYGRPLEPQVGDLVAVSPRVIPHFRTIYVSGVGYRTTGDKGPSGRHIDLLEWDEYAYRTQDRDVWLCEP